jgi:hypothetical protein
MTKYDEFIVLAHSGDIDGPADWTVVGGQDALRAARIKAKRWSDKGWQYVSIRPLGGGIITEEVAA